MLRCYHQVTQNIALVCSNLVDVDSLKPIFQEYEDFYLFEMEHIRKNQELVCVVFYMATNANFLRLNNKCFIQEIIFNLKLTLSEEDRMNLILGNLVDKNYHKEIHKVARSLLE